MFSLNLDCLTNGTTFRLLKAASDFNVQSSVNWTTDMTVKRQCYVHSYVQLICQCTYDPDVNMESITMVILNLMTDIETVVAGSKYIKILNMFGYKFS